jgi:hypothetical protein
MIPFSSFFFTLLETYGLQLHHLLPHSITLVAIFFHLYEMYMGVHLSVHLFRLFHVLCSSRKGCPPSVATTSSTGPRVRMCTSPPSPLASGTVREMIG